MESLLSWVHPGFSVFAGEPVSAGDVGQLERLARYITRPPLPADSIRRALNGMLEIVTPPDSRPGSTVRLLDPLDWIHERSRVLLQTGKLHSKTVMPAWVGRSSILGAMRQILAAQTLPSQSHRT